MSEQNYTTGQLDAFVRDYLYASDFIQAYQKGQFDGIPDTARALIRAAISERKPEAILELQRVAFRIHASKLELPWNHATLNTNHSLFQELLYNIEEAWTAAEREEFSSQLVATPTVEQFPEWITKIVQEHRSNVQHPIFKYLKEEASFDALREFILQETPFDIYFGDIIAYMMPGVYDGMKVELLENFWDEMGHAKLEKMHRTLRLQMMEKLDVQPDIHVKRPEYFCASELQLANLYFFATFDRRHYAQLIGMLLATETMVPGRLDHQIQGWRRVGMNDDDMRYLVEHTVVDVEHAHGWMNEVVVPLLSRHPELTGDIVLGVLRRLKHAEIVCDELLEHIRKL